MGYSTSVYLIYGIPFNYDANVGNSLDWLLKLMVPDLIAEYDLDDVWGCFDNKPHTGGFYLLNFNGPENGNSQLFLACYFHEHILTKNSKDDLLNVVFPPVEIMIKFETWCKENGIIENPKYYTKLYENY